MEHASAPLKIEITARVLAAGAAAFSEAYSESFDPGLPDEEAAVWVFRAMIEAMGGSVSLELPLASEICLAE